MRFLKLLFCELSLTVLELYMNVLRVFFCWDSEKKSIMEKMFCMIDTFWYAVDRKHIPLNWNGTAAAGTKRIELRTCFAYTIAKNMFVLNRRALKLRRVTVFFLFSSSVFSSLYRLLGFYVVFMHPNTKHEKLKTNETQNKSTCIHSLLSVNTFAWRSPSAIND